MTYFGKICVKHLRIFKCTTHFGHFRSLPFGNVGIKRLFAIETIVHVCDLGRVPLFNGAVIGNNICCLITASQICSNYRLQNGWKRTNTFDSGDKEAEDQEEKQTTCTHGMNVEGFHSFVLFFYGWFGLFGLVLSVNSEIVK
tara:strand:+ start:603 stop:1028 length:426 start_codon:yes stop_codon:yes gene_type:complete